MYGCLAGWDDGPAKAFERVKRGCPSPSDSTPCVGSSPVVFKRFLYRWKSGESSFSSITISWLCAISSSDILHKVCDPLVGKYFIKLVLGQNFLSPKCGALSATVGACRRLFPTSTPKVREGEFLSAKRLGQSKKNIWSLEKKSRRAVARGLRSCRPVLPATSEATCGFKIF